MLKHELKTMLLKDLRPAAYNPRKISKEALKGLSASLKRFGLVQPIIFNKRTNHVVGGHQRIVAMLAAGEKTAETVIVDLPLKEEKLLNITLNNPHITGEFTEALRPLLDELKETMPEDFIEMRLDDLLAELPMENEQSDAELLDKIQVTIAEPTTKLEPGQKVQLGRALLIVADPINEVDLWLPELKMGWKFWPYPGPYAAITVEAGESKVLMAQPDPFVAGHIVDRYHEAHQ